MTRFAPNHIFIVSGHGTHALNRDPEDKRYKLKENEFYATQTKCGFVTRALPQYYRNIIEFITSKPRVKIPHERMHTFHTLGDLGQLLQSEQTKKNYLNNNINKIDYITQPHKIYVPFSPMHTTSTVPNDSINLLSYFVIPLDRLRETEEGGTVKRFNFEGKDYIISPENDYRIWHLNVSGLLNAGNESSDVAAQMVALKPKSDALIEALGIDLPENTGEQLVFTSLVVVVPTTTIFGDDLLTTDYSDNPLAQYFKDAYMAVNADAIFRQGYNVDYFSEGPSSLTLMDIMFNHYSISDIYKIIDDFYNDGSSILLINDLCRAPGFENEELSRHMEQGNIPINVKKRMKQTVEENAAISNE